MSSARALRSASSLLAKSKPARPCVCARWRSPPASARSLHGRAAPRLESLAASSRRPTPPLAAATFSGLGGRRTFFIQTESTPNPDAVKFLPNHRVLPAAVGAPFVEYLTPRSTVAPPYPSPLAAQLMAVDGVSAVFYGADFITVTKDADASWAHVRPEVFALITEAISAGQSLVNVSEAKGKAESAAAAAAAAADGEEPVAEVDSLSFDENDSEVVGMIKELLETRIRPSIQEDGGDIEFRGFSDDGYVLLKLRGACRTCDSSTVTLKSGIEGMLMHYVGCGPSVDTSCAIAFANKPPYLDRGGQGRTPSHGQGGGDRHPGVCQVRGEAQAAERRRCCASDDSRQGNARHCS